MGFLSRLFVPRGVRWAMHPVRTVKRATTPKSNKRGGRADHPVGNAAYGLDRSLTTRRRPKGLVSTRILPGEAPHPEAAMKCRKANTYVWRHPVATVLWRRGAALCS